MVIVTIESKIRARFAAHPAVTGVELVGSRARGTAGPLSDWDFAVSTTDFAAVRAGVPRAVAPLRPLASLWDPLSRRANLMLILEGAHKIDLLFDVQQERQPPWTPSATSLSSIDCHFWDWTLWLGGKSLGGDVDLVVQELDKMGSFLLVPMGMDGAPSSLADAVYRFRSARAQLETQFHVHVSRRLEAAVTERLGDHGLLHELS